MNQAPEGRTHKQVLVLRKDLGMRLGKAVAQGAHASMAALLSRASQEEGELRIPLDADIGPWLLGLFTKICVQVPDEEALLDIYDKALKANVPCALIRDSGLTEFHGIPTLTAVAIGPALNSRIDALTGHLKLF